MKILYLIMLSFIFLQPLQAQLTTEKKYIVDSEQTEKQRLVEAKNCFFKTQDDVHSLWKFNFIDLLNTNINSVNPTRIIEGGLEVGYERRIGVGRSLNITLNSSFENGRLSKSSQIGSNLLDYHSEKYGVEFSLEHRWYLNKRKNIKAGLSGNNLSGTYVSLLVGGDWESLALDEFNNANSIPRSIQGKVKTFTYFTGINLGIQKQFTKNGFFDFRVGTGIQRMESNSLFLIRDGQSSPRPTTVDWDGLFNYELGLGLTLENKQIKELPTDCSVFEYHTNKTWLLKLGLTNPVNIFDKEFFHGAFNLGIEKKIRTSPFSLNINLNYDFILFYENPEFEGKWSLDLEPRYYYNLKKRMAQGKTGNSFSANYIGLRSKFDFFREVFTISPIWGIQRQFFKRFLFDYKLGPEWHTQFNEVGFSSELKIGLAF